MKRKVPEKIVEDFLAGRIYPSEIAMQFGLNPERARSVCFECYHRFRDIKKKQSIREKDLVRWLIKSIASRLSRC